MKTKGWFVILQQSEVERCETSSQLLVYASIKSYCGNGKLQMGLSYRDVSKRSKFSIGWTKPIIEELKQLGLVFTHGTEMRRGGMVEVFSVGTVDNTQCVPSVRVSVPSVTLSVPPSGTKNQQSNKVNKNKHFSYKNQKKSPKAGLQKLTPGLEEKLWNWAETISEKGDRAHV